MAAEIFELYQLLAAARSRRAANPEDLSEAEFVALDVMAREGSLTVGEIQRRIGVVPAQMSRIVRSLEENGGKGYITCCINPDDRRCIDLSMTPAGRKAYDAYRNARTKTMYEALSVLDPSDRLDFMRMLSQIRTAFEKKLVPAQ